MLVTRSEFEDTFRKTALRLHGLMKTVWIEGDSRLESACEYLTNAVWKNYGQIDGHTENPISIPNNDVVDIISAMQGRVLTLIEMFLPQGQQCDALKSMAHQTVWECWHDLVQVNQEAGQLDNN